MFREIHRPVTVDSHGHKVNGDGEARSWTQYDASNLLHVTTNELNFLRKERVLAGIQVKRKRGSDGTSSVLNADSNKINAVKDYLNRNNFPNTTVTNFPPQIFPENLKPKK